MTDDEIAEKAAEAIFQRANDTYPRTLHKDMLVDEIGKAIREATRRSLAWPPPVAKNPPVQWFRIDPNDLF